MKMIKRLGTVMAALFLSVFGCSIYVHAADGNISFTDPETAVGEMVEVRCAFRTPSEILGDLSMRLNYDKTALRFQSGDGVTDEGEGVLSYEGAGDSGELLFTMTFQALKEGTTTISIESAAVTSGVGTTLSMDYGSSAVKINPGDPTKILPEEGETPPAAAAGDKSVEVDGVPYTLSDKFAEVDIPSGYARASVSLGGDERQMVLGEGNGVYLAFLVSADGKGEFFVYNTGDSTFSPYEEVAISDMTAIVILSDSENVDLPEQYQEANLTLNGKSFPVWQDNLNEGFYVMHAVNNSGTEGFYQYDTREGTYQRIEIKDKAPEEETEILDESFFGKVKGLFDTYYKVAIPAVAGVLLLLLLILLVVSVKLRNRNLELDDLYDEYGIDEEPEETKRQDVEADRRSQREGEKPDIVEYSDEDDFEEEEFETDFEEDIFGEDETDDEDFREEFASLDVDDVFAAKKTARYDTSGLALGEGGSQSVFDEMRNDLKNDLRKEIPKKNGLKKDPLKKKNPERKKSRKKGDTDLSDIDIIDLD